jgi:hypothetical protein
MAKHVAFRSQHAYRDFVASVRQSSRYVRTADQQAFLDAVAATVPARSVTMNRGQILWRAQLDHDWRPYEDGIDVPAPHPIERMKPLPGKVSDGRANPRGIACLYLASKAETAILEVRPLIGTYVSVAQFRARRELRLVDCAQDKIGFLLNRSPSAEETEKAVWSDMNRAFSAPVQRGDESLDYIPTQILAETFKSLHYDGVGYKSGYGEDGLNAALFDLAAADLVTCGLYRVKDVSVTTTHDESETYYVKDPGD